MPHLRTAPSSWRRFARGAAAAHLLLAALIGSSCGTLDRLRGPRAATTHAVLKKLALAEVAKPVSAAFSAPSLLAIANGTTTNIAGNLDAAISRSAIDDGKMLVYGFGGMRPEFVALERRRGSSDPFETVLRQQYLLEAVRRFYARPDVVALLGQAEPLMARLALAETVVIEEVAAIEGHRHRTLLGEQLTRSRALFDALMTAARRDVELQARARGFEVEESHQVGTSGGPGTDPKRPTVTVITTPADGKVKYLTVAEYAMCHELRRQEHCEWHAISQSLASPSQHETWYSAALAGEYWFQVTWPDGRRYGPSLEADILRATQLRFSPDPR